MQRGDGNLVKHNTKDSRLFAGLRIYYRMVCMMNVDPWRGKVVEHSGPVPNDFEHIARDLCEGALDDAKSQLHPLLQSIGLDRLYKRGDFIGLFKSALELRIAKKLATWQPGVQAVFKYEETHVRPVEDWDGSIRLLVKVSRLSNRLRALGKKLDGNLVNYLRQNMGQRFQARQSILETHQVTRNELRHGIGYGAMFYAVYNVPIKIWPQSGQTK